VNRASAPSAIARISVINISVRWWLHRTTKLCLKAGPTNLDFMTDSLPAEKAAAPGSPFEVPEFSARKKHMERRFFWWSWHPNYPYWSKYGTRGYETEDQAWDERAKPLNSSLDLYHNKLVLEEAGEYRVVADDPCRRLDVWRDIAAMMKENNQAEERL
jgi:hypothetical protein